MNLCSEVQIEYETPHVETALPKDAASLLTTTPRSVGYTQKWRRGDATHQQRANPKLLAVIAASQTANLMKTRVQLCQAPLEWHTS
ncbi:hypothetical protein ECG_05498 [Echinococcus granulosus]|nr:hypothetical protein ECG_05498 [Echinococcus granulosus]